MENAEDGSNHRPKSLSRTNSFPVLSKRDPVWNHDVPLSHKDMHTSLSHDENDLTRGRESQEVDLASFLNDESILSSLSSDHNKRLGGMGRKSSNRNKLVKRMFRGSQYGGHNAKLGPFQPHGTVQKISNNGKRYLQIIVPEEQAEGILAKDSKSTTARASSDLINSPATSNAPVKQASNQTGDYKLDQPGKSPRSFTTDVNEKLGKVGSNESDAVRPWDPSTLTSNHQNNVTDPNHIKRRSSGATDAREALSSHPTLISTSAPHRPLPIIPSRNFTPGTKKRNDVSPQKGREPPAQPLGSPVKRSSVQVMETAQLTNEEVARTDLLDEKRSLDALRIDISAHPRPLKTTGLKSAQPLLSSGTSTPRREFSRPSSSTGPSGRMSTHEERKERTRALKLRDMPRSRQPSSNNLLVPKPTTSDRSTSTLSTLNKGGLSFSPVTTTASISPWDPSNSPKLENKIIRRADNPTKRRNFQSKAGEQPFERSPRELDSAQVNSTIKRYSNSDSDHLLLRSQNRPLSTNDPKELLEQLEKLDRHNKLLEAALAAVLKTNGRLNACPCGGTGLSQTALDAYRTTRRDL